MIQRYVLLLLVVALAFGALMAALFPAPVPSWHESEPAQPEPDVASLPPPAPVQETQKLSPMEERMRQQREEFRRLQDAIVADSRIERKRSQKENVARRK